MHILPDFGKYALFVWTCYGLSLGTLLAFTLATLRMNNRRRQILRGKGSENK